MINSKCVIHGVGYKINGVLLAVSDAGGDIQAIVRKEDGFLLACGVGSIQLVDEPAATVAKDGEITDRHGRMTDAIRDAITGMSVSIDVSTGEHDAEHRLFGVVSEVMDCDGDKHGVTLLVYDTEANFAPKPEASAANQQAGEVESFSNLDSLQQQSEAWLSVIDALNDVSPGWQHGDGTGIEMAVAAIRRLAAPISEGTGKPSDCSGDPACCPDNEGHGCYCTPSIAPAASNGDALPTTPPNSLSSEYPKEERAAFDKWHMRYGQGFRQWSVYNSAELVAAWAAWYARAQLADRAARAKGDK